MRSLGAYLCTYASFISLSKASGPVKGDQKPWYHVVRLPLHQNQILTNFQNFMFIMTNAPPPTAWTESIRL